MKLSSELRTEQLLAVALRLAVRSGWRTLTHQMISEAAGVSQGLVVARLGTKQSLLRDVMRLAVRERNARVVAEGLAMRDRHALKADAELRQAAADWVRA